VKVVVGVCAWVALSHGEGNASTPCALGVTCILRLASQWCLAKGWERVRTD